MTLCLQENSQGDRIVEELNVSMQLCSGNMQKRNTCNFAQCKASRNVICACKLPWNARFSPDDMFIIS